jgi:hypothetical protein
MMHLATGEQAVRGILEIGTESGLSEPVLGAVILASDHDLILEQLK